MGRKKKKKVDDFDEKRGLTDEDDEDDNNSDEGVFIDEPNRYVDPYDDGDGDYYPEEPDDSSNDDYNYNDDDYGDDEYNDDDDDDIYLTSDKQKTIEKIRARLIERISNEINKTLMVSMPINIQFQIITSISISKQTIMDKYL